MQVALRHDDVKLLEGLMDLPLRVDKNLASDISVPVTKSLAAAVAKGDKAKEVALPAGQRCAASRNCVPCCSLCAMLRVCLLCTQSLQPALALLQVPVHCCPLLAVNG